MVFRLGLGLFSVHMGKRVYYPQVDDLLGKAIVQLKVSLGSRVREATSTDFGS